MIVTKQKIIHFNNLLNDRFALPKKHRDMVEKIKQLDPTLYVYVFDEHDDEGLYRSFTDYRYLTQEQVKELPLAGTDYNRVKYDHNRHYQEDYQLVNAWLY